MAFNVQAYDEIIAELRADFLADAAVRLDSLDEFIRRLKFEGGEQKEFLSGVRREVHTLKGTGESFGFRAISLIAHRVEDYLSDTDTLSPLQLGDLQLFLGHMRDIVACGEDPPGDHVNEILRSLPVRRSFELEDIEQRNVEVLLVTPSRVMRHLVELELQACGYRVVATASGMEALKMVVHMKPDLAIASAVLDDVGGVDLARAVKAMKLTRSVPFIVLTSFNHGHPELRGLPKDVAVVRTGERFGEDIATALLLLDIF
jgi:CheY-like chemotaxis protein/HPt (histidine-containing phosphotransfer) domain-containing protein